MMLKLVVKLNEEQRSCVTTNRITERRKRTKHTHQGRSQASRDSDEITKRPVVRRAGRGTVADPRAHVHDHYEIPRNMKLHPGRKAKLFKLG